MKHDPYSENNIGLALPSQIEEDLSEITLLLKTGGEPYDSFAVIDKLVSDLAERAKIIIFMHNENPSSSNKPSCCREVDQPPAVANANAVLYYAKKIKSALKRKKHAKAILIMFKLASSAVRAELLAKAFEGFDKMVAQENGGKASPKLKSLIPLLKEAIASGEKPNAKALWTYIEEHHPSATFYTHEVRKKIEPPPSKKLVNKIKPKDPSAPTELVEKLELYFNPANKDNDSGEDILVEVGPNGVEKTLTFSSFKRYVTEVKKLLSKK